MVLKAVKTVPAVCLLSDTNPQQVWHEHWPIYEPWISQIRSKSANHFTATPQCVKTDKL